FGIPPRFLDHATRKEVLAEIGLTAPDIARQVTGLVAKLDGRYEHGTPAHSREAGRVGPCAAHRPPIMAGTTSAGGTPLSSLFRTKSVEQS
ncbi:hypothetical protein KQH42_30385, partial [Streptomyces sp. CHA1]|uniref:hypothetical protein n=1 Tax=Streptomyces sp. CHA1 TaxID=2841663 RepID=UPI00209526B4